VPTTHPAPVAAERHVHLLDHAPGEHEGERQPVAELDDLEHLQINPNATLDKQRLNMTGKYDRYEVVELYCKVTIGCSPASTACGVCGPGSIPAAVSRMRAASASSGGPTSTMVAPSRTPRTRELMRTLEPLAAPKTLSRRSSAGEAQQTKLSSTSRQFSSFQLSYSVLLLHGGL
jgi:hypothetical protein